MTPAKAQASATRRYADRESLQGGPVVTARRRRTRNNGRGQMSTGRWIRVGIAWMACVAVGSALSVALHAGLFGLLIGIPFGYAGVSLGLWWADRAGVE